MTTATMLGMLSAEELVHKETEGAGTRDVSMYRPTGRPLRNDGIWHYWLARGETYRLEHDGTGWRVTCRTWPGRHTYRLAEADDMRLVESMPLTDGVLTLDRDETYEVREIQPPGAWAVYLV